MKAGLGANDFLVCLVRCREFNQGFSAFEMPRKRIVAGWKK